MKQTILLISAIITILSLNSCKETKKKMALRSSGKTAELIVVTNNKTQWEENIGDSIRAFYQQDFKILPQPEPIFNLANVPMAAFMDSKMFRTHHNVLIIDIKKGAKKTEMEARKDYWASPQRVIKIIAPSRKAFLEFFEEKKEIILGIQMQSERERVYNLFKAFRDITLQEEIHKAFDFTLEIPKGFYIAKKFSNFAWLRKETKNNSQGIMIYTYDFTDTTTFNPTRIISFRDSLTKEYVPGPTEGSYMAVSRDYIKPEFKKINFLGMYAVETRGLWKVENDFMGGPFVSYTFVDEKRNRVITLDGYVYAPNAPKRDLMIQLESIMYSMKLDK
jgi:hypothetical protein